MTRKHVSWDPREEKGLGQMERVQEPVDAKQNLHGGKTRGFHTAGLSPPRPISTRKEALCESLRAL